MRNHDILLIGNGGIAKNKDGISFGSIDTCNFIVELEKKGYKVLYFDRLEIYEINKSLYTYNLDRNNIRFSILHGSRPRSYLSLIKLFIYILFNKNIYIYYPGGFASKASRMCCMLQKKYGIYVRGYGQYSPDGSDKKNLVENFTDSYILKCASFLVTVSPKLKKDLQNLNRNTDFIKPMLIWDLDDIYHKIEKPKIKNNYIILFVGSIHERKGIYEILETADIVQSQNNNIKFRIVGDGPILDHLKKEQTKGYIASNVSFIGGISNKSLLVKEYENADIFYFPTRNEGFPRVIYEAQLKGLPIVTTIVSGMGGYMIPNYNCLEIPVRDPDRQAEVIIEGVNNPGLLDQIAKNGINSIKGVLQNRKEHHEVLINCIEKHGRE